MVWFGTLAGPFCCVLGQDTEIMSWLSTPRPVKPYNDRCYYMAGFMSWPDELNSTLWLATRVGKMELSCLLVTMCYMYVQQEGSLKTMFLTQHVQSRWLDICLVLFVMDLSHLDLTLGQWPIFIGCDCMFVLLCNIYINQLSDGLSLIWFFLTIFKEKRYPPGNSVSKGSWLEWSHGSCKENICGEWQW